MANTMDPTPERVPLYILQTQFELISSTAKGFKFENGFPCVPSPELTYIKGTLHDVKCTFFDISAEESTQDAWFTHYNCPLALGRIGKLKNNLEDNLMIAVDNLEYNLQRYIDLEDNFFTVHGELKPQCAWIVRQLLRVPDCLDKMDYFAELTTSSVFLVKSPYGSDYLQVKLLKVQTDGKGKVGKIIKESRLNQMHESISYILKKMFPDPPPLPAPGISPKTSFANVASKKKMGNVKKSKNRPFSEKERIHLVTCDLEKEWEKALFHPMILNAYERLIVPLLVWAYFIEMAPILDVEHPQCAWMDKLLKSENWLKAIFKYSEDIGSKFLSLNSHRVRLLRNVGAHAETDYVWKMMKLNKKKNNQNATPITFSFVDAIKDLLYYLGDDHFLDLYLDTRADVWTGRVLVGLNKQG